MTGNNDTTERPDGQLSASQLLKDISQRALDEFQVNRRIMSFGEYFNLFVKEPHRYGRSSAQYVRDCFDHFGSVEKPEPWGTTRHFQLFDCPFDEGRDRLVGQERAQEAVYRALSAFAREGRIQRLIILHGPNGSAKSSLIGCVMRALEAYSQTDEGALYCFNWVFPTQKLSRGAIGFGGAEGAADLGLDTFAYLDDTEIDARISDDMRDNPIVLIPRKERANLLLNVLGTHKPGDAWDEKSFVVSNTILDGNLSHMSKQIYEALLASYNGDHSKVLRHVQVERFFISRRYRVGAITVEPQMRVDAGVRQITADRSLQSLPTSLQNQTLFEPFGDLVDGNRGMIEYNDWLKRPPELNKYLLSTSEKGTVALDNAILFIDTVLIGSANETYLEALKQSPDYPSFKARLELIRMPYLLNYMTEQQIYDEQLKKTEVRKNRLPHTTWAAALWAVLTRLVRPRAENHPSTIRDVVANLTPLQKADLYATGKVPEGIPPDKTAELRAAVKDLLDEGEGGQRYEGRFGASPREMKMIMLNAAENSDYPHLSPLAVFEELRRLVKDPTVYPFLQMQPDGPYHRHQDFIDIVIERYLDILDREVRWAMGLVDDEEYARLFSRYVLHLRHWLSGEKVYNETTGQSEEPDQRFMADVEARLAITQPPREFRHDILTSIAAWSIDHPGQEIDLSHIFARHLDGLKRAYYEERKEQVNRTKEHLLLYVNDQAKGLTPADRKQVETTLNNLLSRFGYDMAGAREVVTFLLKHRYG